MKNTTVVTDFKDLRKAIEEITKNQPAETRYQQQAKKMGYTKDKTVVVEQSISEASAFDDMKDIVKTKGAKKIGGVMVDMFTASVITKAYDKVNDANKKKMEKANVQTLVKLAHKVMGLNASFEFDKTPLKGFPFNEVVEDTEIQEWISKNGDRRRVSERDKRKLKEHGLDEGKMSDLLIDIQQGATAKEIAKDFKIPLSVAKGFLQDYYGQKKGSRKESISHDCATHVEHATWGLGTVVSGEHDLVEQEDGSHKVEHYTVEFSHGVEKMISIYELNVTEKMVHSHKMSKDAGRKKLKSSVKKEGQFWGQKKMSKAHKDKLKKDGAVMLQKKEKGGMSRITLAKGHKDIKKYMKQGYKQIQIESVNEAKLETIVLSYDLIKLIGGMSVMKKIMKKHKAYAADKQDVPGKLAISSKIAMGPKGGLIDSINDILIQQESVSEETLSEGTWAVPDSYKKLYNLQVGFLQMPSKPNPNNAKRMAKNIYSIFGDDGFFDDLLDVETGEDTETKDLRDLIVKHLEPWGLKFKKGATYKITHAPQKWIDNMTANPAEEVEEASRLIKNQPSLKQIQKMKADVKKKVKVKHDLVRIQMKTILYVDKKDVRKAEQQLAKTNYKGDIEVRAEPNRENVDETAKRRKSGNLKPTGLGRSMKVDLKANWAKEDKLDPVGKGDDDIDNDGDSDDSDDYLRNRRKKISKAMKMKEANQNAKRSPFKLKSQSYPRAVGIETEGYGTRHASREDIVEACDSFGMITEQELQLEQLQKTLGKSGFLTYNISELNDIFDERETERMILAMESIIPDEKLEPMMYKRDDIDRAIEEELEVEFVKPDGMKAVGPVLKMCENTYNLKDKHTGKSFTFKYEDEGVMKTFNQVISEAKFPKKLVRMAGGIAFDKRYVGGNMTGAVKAIEKLKKGLSDDPQVRDMLRLANESFNNAFYNALSENEKSEYQKFFMSALKKFGVNSPGELEGEKEKDFYNYVDKNWKGKGEKKESVEEGKYSAYSDLLVMKARIIDKEGPKSNKLPAVDDAIRIAMKKLGVKENDTHPSKVKVDGRRTNFREKMKKLGYIKNQY